MNIRYLVLALTLAAGKVYADSSTLDAAIGGGIGGATGAAIGNEVGGRDGAILGGALGGAVGAAVATDGDKPRHKGTDTKTYYKNDNRNNATPFCPPGQAKKGRC